MKSNLSHYTTVYYGIDGCKSGWILVSLQGTEAGIELNIQLLSSLYELKELLDFSTLFTIWIDITIGLSETEERICDKQLRKALGKKGASAFATPIQYAISPTTSTLVMTPTIPGVTFDPTTGIISGVPTLSVVYNYTISSSEGCSNILSGVITVNPDQDISFISTNPTQTACQNSPIDPVVFLVSPGVNDVTITPSLPVGVSYSVISGIVTISGTPTNATSIGQNYIVTTIGSCGVAESETFVLDVRQQATITVTSDVSTINQAICQSGSIEPITFTIGGGATGIETLNLPDNLVLDFDAGTGIYTVSGTPVNFGTFNFNVVTTGCVATQLFSITNINSKVSYQAPIN